MSMWGTTKVKVEGFKDDEQYRAVKAFIKELGVKEYGVIDSDNPLDFEVLEFKGGSPEGLCYAWEDNDGPYLIAKTGDNHRHVSHIAELLTAQFENLHIANWHNNGEGEFFSYQEFEGGKDIPEKEVYRDAKDYLTFLQLMYQ